MSWRPWLVLILLAGGCIGRSAEDVREEFDSFVAERNACSSTAECKMVFPDCPLGCFAYVNARFAVEVDAKAKELVAAYERGGTNCVYDCIQAPPPACTNGRCGGSP